MMRGICDNCDTVGCHFFMSSKDAAAASSVKTSSKDIINTGSERKTSASDALVELGAGNYLQGQGS